MLMIKLIIKNVNKNENRNRRTRKVSMTNTIKLKYY